MNKKLFVLSFASLLALTACSSFSKVSYEDFHAKALETVEGRKAIATITSKGEVVSKGETKEVDVYIDAADPTKNTGDSDVIVVIATMAAYVTADTVSEEENATYYVGNGFKVEAKGETSGYLIFNKEGYVTKYDASNEDGSSVIKLTFSYTYATEA